MPRISRTMVCILTAAHRREDIHLVIRLDDGIHLVLQVDCFATIDKKLHVAAELVFFVEQLHTQDSPE